MLPCKNGCAYRKSIPGDAHSRCTFNWTIDEKKKIKTRLTEYTRIFMSAPKHASQWFGFPINFDPIWGPDSCKYFNEKLNKKYVKEEYDAMVELLSMLR